MAKSDLIQAEIHNVLEYVETTIGVMEKCESFTTDIPEWNLLSHIQDELIGIYNTLGYLLDNR